MVLELELEFKGAVDTMANILAQITIRLSLSFWLATISLSVAQEPSADEILQELKSNDIERIVPAIKQVEKFSIRDQRIVERLVLLLDDGRRDSAPAGFGQNVQAYASFAMQQQGDKAVATILQHLPEIKSEHGLCLALGSIANICIRDLDAYNAVLPYLRHKDVAVRSRAIFAIDRLAVDEPALVSKLASLLQDESALIRATAIGCLERHLTTIGPALESIGKLLIDDSDYYVAVSNHSMTTRKLRASVAKLLGKVGPTARRYLPMLRDLLTSQEDVDVKIWSATAICAISESPPADALALLGDLLVSDLEEVWCDNDATEAIVSLGRRALPIADKVHQATKHKSSLIRMGLAKAFFAIDPESAVPKVVLLSLDEDDFVVEAAIEELSRNNAHGPKVVESYINALNRESTSLRYSAIQALNKLGSLAEVSIPALERLIADAEEGSKWLKDEARDAIASIRK